jgi:tetratricopeptide (TPR) repeat protein
MLRVSLPLMLLLASTTHAGPYVKVERAKRLFAAGELHYRLGEFREAVASYRAAMRLAPRPNILFNIAQCFRQLRDSERALFHYRLYLSDWRREHPGQSPPFEREVKEHIARLVELQRRAPESQPTSTSAPVGAPDSRPAASPSPALSPPAPAPPAAVTHEERGGSGLWLGLGLGATGLAVAWEAVALVYTFKARERYTDEPEFDTYRRVAIAGHVLAATMAAAAIVSWVLYLRSRNRASHPDVALGPGWIAGRF